MDLPGYLPFSLAFSEIKPFEYYESVIDHKKIASKLEKMNFYMGLVK